MSVQALANQNEPAKLFSPAPGVRPPLGASVRSAATVFAFLCLSSCAFAQTEEPTSRPNATEKIIIDTDIGNDIDDAFAVGLALQSPELQILGISSAWGDTPLRARLLSRL